MRRVDGKVCIITGAAKGIGRAIALRLAEEGAKVCVADLDIENAEAVAKEIQEKGFEAFAFQVDVTEREQVKDMIQQTVERFGKLDVMFNNAGLNRPMKFLEVTEENWDFIMRVNGLGVLIGMQEAAKQMIAQGNGGKIINTGSICSRQAYPEHTPYGASKFAVHALTQAGARALYEHNITVNCFAPGIVDTPLMRQLDLDLVEIGFKSKAGEAWDFMRSQTLLQRHGVPEDMAGFALYLASSDSDYMTGQLVMINGGACIQ